MTGRRVLVAVLLCWSLTAEVLRVVDADTFRAHLTTEWQGVGLGVESTHRWMNVAVRLLGVDAFEARDPKGPEGTAFAASWLAKDRTPDPGPVRVRTCVADSFGRRLGTVTRGSENLADELLKRGLAVPYKR